MKLRDVSTWGFFKLILVTEYAIAIILLPILLLLLFLFSNQKPELAIDNKFKPDIFGISINLSELSLLPAILIGFFWLLIATIIKSWFLTLICKYTPFGKIEITSLRS